LKQQASERTETVSAQCELHQEGSLPNAMTIEETETTAHQHELRDSVSCHDEDEVTVEDIATESDSEWSRYPE
jgi:hypothetical protein